MQMRKRTVNKEIEAKRMNEDWQCVDGLCVKIETMKNGDNKYMSAVMDRWE